MTERTSGVQPTDYWRDLASLFSGDKVLYDHMDMSLEATTVRSRYASAWSGTLIAYAVAFTELHRHGFGSLLNQAAMPVRVLMLVVLAIVLAVLSGVVLYGFLRLYTLVGHNLTTNLFKVRGQRLRLLSAETTVLSLGALVAVALALRVFVVWLGWIMLLALLVYAVILLARAYNFIFHLKAMKGLYVLIGGTLVSWFVLAIGALAIAVAVAVIGFLLLLVLRLFRH